MKRLPVRESCGFLTGVLLHRSLGEEPCDLCATAAQVRFRPLKPTAEETARNREILEREARRGNKHRRGDYQFPVS